MEKNYEIVVAHYNEDIERLKPYAEDVIIYHKWNETWPRFPIKKWIKLDNVWREGHTYLHHIIHNYDNLTEYTIFLQWSISDHSDNGIAYNTIQEYIDEVKKYEFSTKSLWLMRRQNPQIVWLWKFKDMIDTWSLQKSWYSFQEFYKLLFKKKQPYLLPVFYGANFGVSKKKIQQRKKDFFQQIYNIMNQSPNPEEWHYLERLWFQIFNEKNISYYYITKILKDLKKALLKKIKHN